jgi:hypothetical protein
MRQHDSEENVRYEVVMAIVTTARRDFEVVSDSEDLLEFVKERTLDKKVIKSLPCMWLASLLPQSNFVLMLKICPRSSSFSSGYIRTLEQQIYNFESIIL